jgi:hypothetical protein
MTDMAVASYIMSLDDLGDLQAPKGSQPWARAVRYQLQTLARQSKTSVRDFQTYLKLLEESGGYQQLEDGEGRPFTTLSAFAVAKMPFGLGYDPEIILHIQEETRDMLLGQKLDEIEAQRTLSEAMRGNQNARQDANSGYNYNRCLQEPLQRGTSAAYRRRVLKRDRPDIFDGLQRGQYRSVNAAWNIATGKTPETPFQALLRAWRRVSREDRVRFLREELLEEERAELAEELLAIETRTVSPLLRESLQ